uniref:Uncharacterized protein n=1 Tax=Physcomitrium patens TaxID=3218 RepID=A0A2K1KT37_PHYPA|nr:hypothetical protein PHYPA_003940 [Physcomitrium patens]
MTPFQWCGTRSIDRFAASRFPGEDRRFPAGLLLRRHQDIAEQATARSGAAQQQQHCGEDRPPAIEIAGFKCNNSISQGKFQPVRCCSKKHTIQEHVIEAGFRRRCASNRTELLASPQRVPPPMPSGSLRTTLQSRSNKKNPPKVFKPSW